MSDFLTRFTHHVEANIWLNAAQAHGWETEVLVPEKALAFLRKGQHQYQICRGVLSANPGSATEISQDKYLTNLVLKDEIPYLTKPQQYLVDEVSDQEIQRLLNEHQTLVVKPVDTNNGVGVSTFLKTVEQVKTAIQRVKDVKSKWVLIENHVHASNEYRIILWKGKVIDILHRIPAFVVGDGQRDIQSLITQKNETRATQFYGIFDPIVIDDSLKEFLQQQALQLTSVPSAEQKVTVRQMCNLSQGGETERVPVTALHPEYHQVFEQVARKTWLSYCGVDLIAPDISSKPDPAVSVINELNGAPALSVAFFADLKEGKPFYGAGQILAQMEQDPIHIR